MILDPPPPAAATPVEWTFDPWHERPAAATVAVVAVLAFWFSIAVCRFPLLLAVALGAIAASPLVPAFVPAACRVGPAGASRRGLLLTVERAWRDVRRVDDVPAGVLLSPFATRSWLDATRSLTLPMPGPRRPELRERVRRLWGAHAG
jgi:hypothetical protein